MDEDALVLRNLPCRVTTLAEPGVGFVITDAARLAERFVRCRAVQRLVAICDTVFVAFLFAVEFYGP
jgi:hypothetical protein